MIGDPVSKQRNPLQQYSFHFLRDTKSAFPPRPQAPLAMGGFATTLASVSMAMMNFRGVTTQTMFIGNLCFVACIGLVISGQWAMAKGDTFTYTVLTAYGLFYGGYGAMLFPNWNIASSYGTSSEYYNAFGFFLLVWAISNIFFLITSLRL